MNIQVRTILLGLLSIGFVQSYAQTFALQVKNDQITFFLVSIPLMYFSILVYPSPLQSMFASAGSFGFNPLAVSQASGIPSPSESTTASPLYSGSPPT